MYDMLVKLYTLPPLEAVLAELAANGITVRRSLPSEKHLITAWVGEHFSPAWVSETDVAYSHHPPSLFVAIEGQGAQKQMLGFAAYDVSAKGVFGPTGVGEAARGKGIGRALLLACLHDMRAQGYAYGVIGGTDDGPGPFYARVVGAVKIADSDPGMYANVLGWDAV